jgi:hypothetical protein
MAVDGILQFETPASRTVYQSPACGYTVLGGIHMADHATMEDLLSLPAEERAGIAELLLESLNSPEDSAHRDAWIRETALRYAAWERGETGSADAMEVAGRLRKAYSP